MRPLMHRSRPLVLTLLLLASFTAPVRAAWSTDGGPVTTSPQNQNQPVVAGDALGGAFMAWVDGRSGFNTDIYGVRWNAAGVTQAGWTSGGSNVTAITCAKYNPVMIPDGAGGALLAWEDNRCTGYTNIYARRVSATGVAAGGWPDNGIRLVATTTNQTTPLIASDGAGGAFITWREAVNNGDILLQHLTATGALASGWTSAGVVLATGSASQSPGAIAPDGAGGVFVAWQEGPSGNTDVRLQHLTATGTRVPGFVDGGNGVCNAVGDQTVNSMVADGAGGVLLAWTDRRGADDDVAVQRVNGDGSLATGFPIDGRVLCNASGQQTRIRLQSDGASGAFVVWEDRRTLGADLYGTHLLADGTIASGFAPNGNVVASATNDQTNPAVCSDGSGGAFVVWEDQRNGNVDVYATRLTADGTLPEGWTPNGTLVCGAAQDQTSPQIAAAAGGTAFVVWTDTRNIVTSFTDVYAHHLLANGPEQVRPTGLTALHHDGQTFLTWNPPPGTGWKYRVYHSASPIATDADLNTATLLGSVGDSAATDRRLSSLTKVLYTFRTDSTATPLAADKGLFVVTVPATRQGWYAVTSQLTGSAEDRHVIPGGNALISAVSEVLALPRPVFQRPLTVNGITAKVFTLWTWNVDTPLFPAMCNVPSWPFDASVTSGIPQGPAFMRFHALGGAFTQGFQTSGDPSEWVVALDDYSLNGDIATWWHGYHPGYDLTANGNPVPTTGTIIDYTNRRALHTIRWARATFDLDTTRVYAFGFSLGGTYSLQLAFLHPELISAAMASTGKVDYSFQSEPVLNAGYNPSGQYRPIVNRLWGTVASNLPSSLGLPMYTLMNDDALAARTVGRGAAFMINFSGRHDETVGWAEKLGFFDAMRRYHQGHVDYWDNRDHSGFVYPGGMASNLDPRWLYRFRSTLSWPAFSNCSADDAPGDGTVASGDTLGTINGTMDWDPAVSDSAARWTVTLKTRTIPTLWGTRPAPESLTVDVTPRRVQRFTAAPGTSVTWSAVRISDNATVQQGSVTVDPDGLVTVPQVRTYRTGTRLTLVAPPPGLGIPDAPHGARTLLFSPLTNPARDRIRLTVDWPRDGAARIELFDTSGRLIRTLLDGPVQSGSWHALADLTGLAPGVYLTRALQGDRQALQRVVVLH
mgnify:CR=1 FL=1